MVRPLLIVMLVSVGLAGCSSPSPEVVEAAPAPPPAFIAPASLIEGTLPWQEDPAPAAQVTAAEGAVFGYCLRDGGEVSDAGSIHLTSRLQQAPVPAGATRLQARAEWTEADYAWPELRLVWDEPGAQPQMGLLLRGETAVFDFQRELTPGEDWDFWLCTRGVVRGNPLTESGLPFVGQVTIKVEAVP